MKATNALSRNDEADSSPVNSAAAVGGESASPLARLQHVSLQERVYQELRAAIRAGRFTSGETVTIRGLAELLGTSTMPVRGAVHRMVQDRTLEMLPNRSLRVPMLSRVHFDELIDVRATIEGHAAELAAEHINNEQYAALKAANQRMEKAIADDQVVAVLAANQEFHFGIYRAARSQLLLSMIENLWDQSGPYIAAVTQASLLQTTEKGQAPSDMVIAHHYEALTALGNRDGAAARAAVATDILHSAGWYRASIFYPVTNAASGETAEAPTS